MVTGCIEDGHQYEKFGKTIQTNVIVLSGQSVTDGVSSAAF